MNVSYKSAFEKFVKKQRRPFQLTIEDEVEKISKAPKIGVAKKGDLAKFRVHKFIFQKQQYLIAYKMEGNDIFFYMINTHENFYRELKRYVKEVE